MNGCIAPQKRLNFLRVTIINSGTIEYTVGCDIAMSIEI